jgi:hypothetical protein
VAKNKPERSGRAFVSPKSSNGSLRGFVVFENWLRRLLLDVGDERRSARGVTDRKLEG